MRSALRGLSANLNLTLLRTFVRVVDVGNITAAARSLFLSQSAVSMQLTALGTTVGLPLLERVRGRWEPTAAGRELYESASEVLGIVERLERRVSDLADRQTARMTLSCTRIVAELVLAPVVAGFAQVRPDIRLDVSLSGCQEVQEQIARKEVDAALTARPFEVEQSVTRRIAGDELVALVAADHPLAAGESVTLDQMAVTPLVLHGAGSSIQGLLRERLGDRFDDLDVVHQLGSSEAVAACVEAGLGCSFLPRLVAERAARWARVVARPVSGVDLRREVIVATSLGETSAATGAFVEWLGAADHLSTLLGPSTDASPAQAPA
ncbi:MAG TPA: LysR family transcriptional regulator [Candidatus Dormibacteraeota bacterium]|nr:LysR family transcriptional regulator [Candidatus Dormibacteraeota bacterium]